MSAFGYVAPHSLVEAVAILADNPAARPLAGGHGLLLPARRNQLAGALLVDLRKIDALAGVQHRPNGDLRIGATTTIAALAESLVVRQAIPELCQTALLVGDAQLRNRATIAGNLVASEPGADLPALLLGLNARVEIVGTLGEREIPIEEFLAVQPQAALHRDELIVSVTVPALPVRTGVAYEKLTHMATLFALCGVAAAVRVTAEGRLSDVRIVVTGATTRAQRLPDVEQVLAGGPTNEASILAATRLIKGGSDFFTDLFASAEYRQHLTHVLAERALKRAIATATA